MSLGPSVERALSEYVRLVRHWSRGVNLVGMTDAQRIVDELLADVLPVVAEVTEGDRLLDVGSGAGLPGLVAAILSPGALVTLWEPRQRRAAFLRAAIHELALGDRVGVRRTRLEAGTSPVRHDLLVSRAVWPLATWLTKASPVASRAARVLGLTSEAPSAHPEFELLSAVSYRIPSNRRARFMGVYRRVRDST